MNHFYQNLDGERWFDYEDVYRDAVKNAGNRSHFVELGSWRGASACFMAVEIENSGKSILFDCVDNWSQGDVRDVFFKNIMPVRGLINIIEGVSWEVADEYGNESIDFCFVDAGHDYDSKAKDVKAWLPKIKKGGVMAGHDYTPEMDDYNRTYEAVNNVLGKENIEVIRNVWIYKKPL